jgi:hypothetical protein
MSGIMYSYYTSIGFYSTFLQNYVEIEKTVVTILIIVGTTSHYLDKFLQCRSQKRERKTIALFAISNHHSNTIFTRNLTQVQHMKEWYIQ